MLSHYIVILLNNSNLLLLYSQNSQGNIKNFKKGSPYILVNNDTIERYHSQEVVKEYNTAF